MESSSDASVIQWYRHLLTLSLFGAYFLAFFNGKDISKHVMQLWSSFDIASFHSHFNNNNNNNNAIKITYNQNDWEREREALMQVAEPAARLFFLTPLLPRLPKIVRSERKC